MCATRVPGRTRDRIVQYQNRPKYMHIIPKTTIHCRCRDDSLCLSALSRHIILFLPVWRSTHYSTGASLVISKTCGLRTRKAAVNEPASIPFVFGQPSGKLKFESFEPDKRRMIKIPRGHPVHRVDQLNLQDPAPSSSLVPRSRLPSLPAGPRESSVPLNTGSPVERKPNLDPAVGVCPNTRKAKRDAGMHSAA